MVYQRLPLFSVVDNFELIVSLDVGIPLFIFFSVVDKLKIIYNGKNINNGIPTPRPMINSKLYTTKKI
jgi:hypothetical protein